VAVQGDHGLETLGQGVRLGSQVVARVAAEQHRGLGDVRGQHDLVRAVAQQVRGLAEGAEGVRVQHERGVLRGRVEHQAQQAAGLLDVVQARPDREHVRLGGQLGELVVVGEPDHLGLRHGDAQRGRGAGLHGKLQPSCAGAQRGHPGEQHRAGRGAGSADDQHGTAGLLVALRIRQRPLAQQVRGDDRLVRPVRH
jgi:hypothetical protein